MCSIYYCIEASEEIQTRKWIPERQGSEQFPGRTKKYSFDSRSFRLFWMRPFWIIFRVRLFDPSLVKALEGISSKMNLKCTPFYRNFTVGLFFL